MVHAALLLLTLEALTTDLVSPSAWSAAPKIFSYPQARRPTTPSLEGEADSICSVREFPSVQDRLMAGLSRCNSDRAAHALPRICVCYHTTNTGTLPSARTFDV